MNDIEFNRLLAYCVEELKQKQHDLDLAYGLSAAARWQFEAEEGVLVFMDERGQALHRFSVTPIGTFAAQKDSWKWAWANGHLPQSLRGKAGRIKSLQAETDFDLFTNPDDFSVDEAMAWELAAISVQFLGALGCYRTPNRDTYLFLALEARL